MSRYIVSFTFLIIVLYTGTADRPKCYIKEKRHLPWYGLKFFFLFFNFKHMWSIPMMHDISKHILKKQRKELGTSAMHFLKHAHILQNSPESLHICASVWLIHCMFCWISHQLRLTSVCALLFPLAWKICSPEMAWKTTVAVFIVAVMPYSLRLYRSTFSPFSRY